MEFKDDIQEAVREYIVTQTEYSKPRETISHDLIEVYYYTFKFATWYKQRANFCYSQINKRDIKDEKNIFMKIFKYFYIKFVG